MQKNNIRPKVKVTNNEIQPKCTQWGLRIHLQHVGYSCRGNYCWSDVQSLFVRAPVCCPAPTWGPKDLAPASWGCLPAEMLVVVPLACVIREDFQDSGSDSRNLPVCWQIYWPGLESLGWEKIGWKGGWWLPAILIFLPIGAPPAEAVQMSCLFRW